MVNISDFLSNSNTTENYEIRREKFIKKYMQVLKTSPEEFINAVCDYSLEFQTMFIEEMISTLFEAIINPESNRAQGKLDKADYRDRLAFFCNMIHYYALHEIIIFYNMAQPYIRETYDFDCEECKTKSSVLNTMEFSIGHIKCKHCPKLVNDSLYENTQALLELTLDPPRVTRGDQTRTQITNSSESIRAKKPGKLGTKKKSAINGNLLPIGYFMQKVPRFYHPIKGWYDAADYSRGCRTFTENDIIIGYFQKTQTGLRVIFKVRRPIHKQDNKGDSRKSEKGTACESKSKAELVELLSELGTKISEEMSISELCETLKYRLLYLEIIERRKPQSNLKYFYQYWECQPTFSSEIL